MGLDSYLKARKSIHGYDENKEDYLKLVALSGLLPKEIQASSPFGKIELTVAYWRKVNSVHNWFVTNCQNGVDDCADYYISKDQLGELRDLGKDVIQTKDTSKLENVSGFFFGSINYDEGYFNDLEETVAQLNSILNNPKFESWSFYYQSSW